MGSSLILTGGAATAKTLKETITQTAHGFTVGDVIRWDSSASTPKYVLAQADSAANAEVAGVVSARADANNFDVTYHGYIDLPNLAGISAPVMFLSSVAGGSLSPTPPSAVGTVVKPILTRNTNGSGHLVMNYLGTQIGGSSTIAVDEIQPVGTIMPFAGNAIPDTWLECDAGQYSVTDYPELYSKLLFTTGDKVPVYGYTAVLTVSGNLSSTGIAVGDTLHFKKNTNAWTTTTGGSSNEEILYRSNTEIIATVTGVNTTAGTITVILFPNYNKNTTENAPYAANYFTFPNVAFGTGTFTNSAAGSNYRVLYGPGTVAYRQAASLTVTSVAITHFRTPDLRGRMPIGPKTSSIYANEIDGDPSYIHSLPDSLKFGSLGGEAMHQLTTAEMPSHSHTVTNGNSPISRAFQADGNASGTSPSKAFQYADAGVTPIQATGGNDPHNNLPPYLVTRYIIKAKPYTRAAIIDGIDLPYNSLLVRDLRSRNVGGANGDLGIYTNTPGDAGTGTLRAVFTQGGTFAIGNAVSSSSYGDYANFVLKHNGNSEIALVKADASGADTGVALRCFSSRGTVAVPLAVQSGDYLSRISGFGWDGTIYGNLSGVGGRNGGLSVLAEENFTSNAHGTALSFEFTPRGRTAGAEGMRFTSDSRLGIGTATPGASLDVNGTLKVGDFGGTTNVMPKPTMSSGVGQVVPLLCYGGGAPTTLLSSGTWFVFFTGYMNGAAGSAGAVDENPVVSGAFTVTLTSGQFFGLQVSHDANVGARSTTANLDQSGVIYRIFTDATLQNTAVPVNNSTHAPASGWTEFTENSSSPFKAKRYFVGATPISPALSDGASVVYHTSSSIGWAAGLNGYAIRIA